MSTIRPALRAVTALVGVLACHPAFAQSEAPTPSAAPAIGDIVVTARRTEEKLQSVPVAVTALDANYLQQHSIQSVTDLNNHVPSLQINGISSPDQFQFGIRGQRNAEYGPGEDPAIGTYFADVPYNLAVGFPQQFFDLQSIQVLKGPQGTLFGLSTTGGAILLTPAKPVDHFEANFTAGVKTFNNGTGPYGTGVINIPLVGDKLMVRAALNIVQRPGYVKDEGPVPSTILPPDNPNHLHQYGQNDDHSGLFRLSVLARPVEGFENSTIFSIGRMRDHGAGLHITALNPDGFVALVFPQAQALFDQQQAMYAKNFWTTQSSIQQYVKVNTKSVVNTTTIDIGDDFKLINVGGYRDFQSRRFWDLGAMPIPILGVPTDQRGKEYSDELRLTGSLADGWIKLTTGVFYFVQDANVVYGASVLGGPPNAHLYYAYSRSLAAYAQADVKTPVDGLTVTLGARYTIDRRRGRVDGFSPPLGGCILTTMPSGAPYTGNGCNLIGSKKYNTPTWTVSSTISWTAIRLCTLPAAAATAQAAGRARSPISNPSSRSSRRR